METIKETAAEVYPEIMPNGKQEPEQKSENMKSQHPKVSGGAAIRRM